MQIWTDMLIQNMVVVETYVYTFDQWIVTQIVPR